MNEVSEQSVTTRLALDEVHSLYGAAFRDENGWRVPANYGDFESEYQAVRNGRAGIIDLSSRGRIRVNGSEAVMFLNGLITNDMKTLGDNRSMPAVFPTVQGRLIAAVRIVRIGETFLIETEPATRDRVLKTIDRFTLAGDFRVADVTDTTTMIAVQGKDAREIAGKILGETLPIDRDGAQEIEWHDHPLTILRATHTAEDGFDLIVPTENATVLWDTLVEAGAHPVGYDALETLRVEAGIARYGIDMDETNVVTETNLDDAVSFTKGCYVGQEIIVRIKHRGHVAKKLTGIRFETEKRIESGTKVESATGSEIGRLTSAQFSPTVGKCVALAYLKYDYLAAGTTVKVQIENQEISASVHDLPFVRGSWYQDQANNV
jgi:glycine cleavage system T protein